MEEEELGLEREMQMELVAEKRYGMDACGWFTEDEAISRFDKQNHL